MNKLFTAAMGLALTATAFTASAQKTYTEGTATYTATVNGQSGEAKILFKGDSSLTLRQQGPAVIKIITFKDEYIAVIVDVPVANMKKAAVAAPADVEDFMSKMPTFTFAPTTETKVISGFNCKKVIATDAKSKATYDTWVTTDIAAPSSAFGLVYAKAGGFPVQFTIAQMGTKIVNTLASINDTKLPKGTFGIPAGFDRISWAELNAMSGGR